MKTITRSEHSLERNSFPKHNCSIAYVASKKDYASISLKFNFYSDNWLMVREVEARVARFAISLGCLNVCI